MNPFPMLDTVAPAIGARMAERLWFTPPRGAKPGPTPRSTGTDFTLRAVDTTLSGRTWGIAGNPIAVLMHGWGGTKEQMTAFVDPLVDAGFEVVAFDGPSHGASGPGRHGPQQTTFVEFIEALEALAAEFGPIHTVIAHSGGAMATVGAIRGGQLDIERLVLISAFSKVRPFTHVFAQLAGFGERTRSRMEQRLEKRIASPIDDWDLAATADEVAHVPVLLLHDEGDTQTPVGDTRALAEAWSGSELVVTEGLGHNKILGDPGVVARVTDFVAAVRATS